MTVELAAWVPEFDELPPEVATISTTTMAATTSSAATPPMICRLRDELDGGGATRDGAGRRGAAAAPVLGLRTGRGRRGRRRGGRSAGGGAGAVAAAGGGRGRWRRAAPAAAAAVAGRWTVVASGISRVAAPCAGAPTPGGVAPEAGRARQRARPRRRYAAAAVTGRSGTAPGRAAGDGTGGAAGCAAAAAGGAGGGLGTAHRRAQPSLELRPSGPRPSASSFAQGRRLAGLGEEQQHEDGQPDDRGKAGVCARPTSMKWWTERARGRCPSVRGPVYVGTGRPGRAIGAGSACAGQLARRGRRGRRRRPRGRAG